MDQFLNKVFLTIYQFGGIKFLILVAVSVLLCIGFFKFSSLRPIWDRLGRLKPLGAPVLSLFLGLLSLALSDEPLTIHGIVAYLFAGSGAIILHDILDAVKALPGISPAYANVISSLQGLLRRWEIKNKLEKDTNEHPRTLNDTINRP